MNKIREDSQFIEFYNDGLVIFLYDDASSETIKNANPDIFQGFGAQHDAALATLAKDGLLVCYELQQDDSLQLELCVGHPLTQDEINKGGWFAVQQAPIHLPSGKLCIESYNNFRLSPDFDPNEEPGAIAHIPPGQYILSLYRSNLFDAEEGASNWDVIVLTKASETNPLTDVEPILRFPIA